MKKNIIICLMTVSLVGVNSCADLDLPSDGRLTLKEIFDSYHRTKNYYNSCKAYFPQVGFMYGGPTLLASFSDEAHDASDGISGAVNNWYNIRTSPTNNPVTGSYSWAHYFQGIRKCNSFLASIQDPNLATAIIDEVEKNGWIGEIYTLRAYLYLQLIKRWGGVPILDIPYEVTHDFSKDRRATFEECVDFIIADCDAALAFPDTGQPNTGFRWYIADHETNVLTRAFAYAVKSQAALYAASPLWHTQGSKYTWARVTDITKEALDQCLTHGFELFNITAPNNVAQNAYAHYFINDSDPSRSVDKETIYESSSRTNVWANAGTPITNGSVKAGAGPSQEMIDAYCMHATGEMPILGYADSQHLQPIINPASGYDPSNPYEGRDPRFYASIYYNNSPRTLPNGTPVQTFVGGNCGISSDITQTKYTRTGYYLRKFNDHRSNVNLNRDGKLKIFRLGELYLNFAEAASNAVGYNVAVEGKASGAVALSARQAVNIVRARAEMPPIPTGLSNEEFQIRYRNERRVELAFEEHRFFDVRRWKILNETDEFVTGMSITKEGDKYVYNRVKLQDRGTNTDKYLMFPIDFYEVTKMESLTGENWQNPGW